MTKQATAALKRIADALERLIAIAIANQKMKAGVAKAKRAALSRQGDYYYHAANHLAHSRNGQHRHPRRRKRRS